MAGIQFLLLISATCMTFLPAAMAQGLAVGDLAGRRPSVADRVLAAAEGPAADQLIGALKTSRIMRCPRGSASGCGDPQTPAKDDAIFFARGSARVGTTEMAKLRQLARQVARTRPKASFLLIGQTDASGDTGRNHRLALQRAMAVKSLLVSRFGIAYYRLATRSSAELAHPEAPLASENRRVKLVRWSGN